MLKNYVSGYMILWIDEDKAQINSLVIVQEFRKKGYGTYFLESIIQKLAKEGIIDLTLEVRPSNINALNLYTKLGFKQVSIRKAYYNNGEDAFLMYKRLGSE